MISTDVFMFGVMIVSTLTGLITEAIKKILSENNVTYRANTIAGIVSIVLSVLMGIGYAAIANVGFGAPTIVCIIALTVVGWLCATLGYDKVMGIIGEFKTIKKDDEE